MKILKNLEKFLQVITVLLIPTQFGLHFWPSYSFIFGIRIDYLSPTIFSSDIAIIALLLVWAVLDFDYLKKQLLDNRLQILGLFVFIVFNTVFSTNWLISVFKWFSLIEVVLLGLYFYRRVSVVAKKTINKALYMSLVIISIIGVLQFITGKTIGGLLYYLGERNFNILTPGISLVQIFGIDHLRAYSVFPHPNALAGFIGLAILYLINDNFNRFALIYTSVLVLAFVLTFSLSGYLAFCFCLLLILINKKNIFFTQVSALVIITSLIVSLLTPIIASKVLSQVNVLPSNVSERLYLAVTGIKMIEQKYMFGVGINNFIPNIQSYVFGQESPVLLQPVHNVFLLILSELGIVGLLIVVIYVARFLMMASGNFNYRILTIIVFVVLSGFFDHYWLTIHQNIILASVLLGLSSNRKE